MFVTSLDKSDKFTKQTKKKIKTDSYIHMSINIMLWSIMAVQGREIKGRNKFIYFTGWGAEDTLQNIEKIYR